MEEDTKDFILGGASTAQTCAESAGAQRQSGKAIQRDGPRIRREKETVALMIHLYCNRRHNDRTRNVVIAPDIGLKLNLCEECHALYAYANQRLSQCRFGENKSTCLACPVHCYAASQREKIRKVMRYAGPRMLLRHPILTLMHSRDGRKRPIHSNVKNDSKR